MRPWQSGYWYCWAAYFDDLVKGFLHVANTIDINNGDLPADFGKDPQVSLFDWAESEPAFYDGSGA